MRSTGIKIVVILFLFCQISYAKQTIKNSNYKGEQWKLSMTGLDKNTEANLRSGVRVNLKNVVMGRFLIYKTRKYGIDASWTKIFYKKENSFNILFERKNKRDRSPLKYGEPVAFKISPKSSSGSQMKGGYLEHIYPISTKYLNATIVKSLGRTSYQWKIIGGKRGTAIRINSKSNPIIGLYNTETRGYLAYRKQRRGINLKVRYSGRKKVVDHR